MGDINDATNNGISLNIIQVRSQTDLEDGNNIQRQIQSNTSHQGVTSLQIMSNSFESEDSLMASLSKNKAYISFLKWTGNYYPPRMERKDWNSKFHRGIFVLCRLIILEMIVLSIYVVIYTLLASNSVQSAFWIAQLLDYCSLLPSQYYNQLRLERRGRIVDASVLDSALRITSAFGLVSATCVVFGLIVFCGAWNEAHVGGSKLALNLITLLFHFTSVMYLSFNLLFLTIDLQVCSLLLDQVDILVDCKALTFDKFNLVRDDIHRRYQESRWITDIVIVPCGASAIAIALIVYFLENDSGPYDSISSSALILMLLKQVGFLGVAFWYVAKVNGKADAITVKLSREIWRKPVLTPKNPNPTTIAGTCSTASTATAVTPESSLMVSPTNGVGVGYFPTEDLERLSVHASSLSEPISYQLLFKRINWQNVIVSASGFALTVVVGIGRNVAGV